MTDTKEPEIVSPSEHWRYMGAFVALGVIVTILDFGAGAAVGPMSSFTGLFTALYWGLFAVFALVSTLSLRVLQRSRSLYAMGNSALIVSLLFAANALIDLQQQHADRLARENAIASDQRIFDEAASCGTLVSWHMDETDSGATIRVTIDPHKDGTLRVGADEGVLLGYGEFDLVDKKHGSSDYPVRAGSPLNTSIALQKRASSSGSEFSLFFCCDAVPPQYGSTCTGYTSTKEPRPTAARGTAEYALPPPR